MANQEQLEILKSGVENWNRWRQEYSIVKIDLHHAKLEGAYLKEADLSRVDFSKAKLFNADLSGASLCGADLSGADLSRANLRKVDLSNANLSGTDLRGADLSGANLSMTNLLGTYFIRTEVDNANFSDARLGLLSFLDIDLTNVVGLETCKHTVYSFIDYHTLAKSKNIPSIFLRGCGLSDDYINAIPSLFEQPLQFYSCFISYSTKDQDFAERLYSDLQNRGIRAWYAPHELIPGQKIIDQIDRGIKVTDKLLLILSENSIGSDWVKSEISKAYKKGKKIGKQVLFPISITNYDKLKEWKFYLEGKDMSQEIRDYYLLNFEDWKDDGQYKKNFDKLIEGLMVEPIN